MARKTGKRTAPTLAFLAVAALTMPLSGCAALGLPESLDDEQLTEISARVSDSQRGLDATLRAETKTCEGLCQRFSLDLTPRTPDYTAVDIALAIYETDTALDERNITAFDYCFNSLSWDLADAQYLDARLSEIPALLYGDFTRDKEQSRPSSNCWSFAAIGAREQLASFLTENGAPGF